MAGLARAALLAAATVAAAAGSGGVGGLLLGREVQLDAARTPRAIAARVVVCEAAVGRALHHDLEGEESEEEGEEGEESEEGSSSVELQSKKRQKQS